MTTAQRLDLKCGKGAISQGEKCHKGPASKVDPDQASANATKVAIGVGVAGLAVAALLSRKQWTEAATKLWQNATPFNPAKPPKGAEYLSQGNNGTIWISKDRKSIVKIPKNKRSLLGLDEEVAIQIKLREAGVSTPAIYHYGKQGKGVIHMEFMDGYKPLSHALKAGSAAQKATYARKFTEELGKMHSLGYAHGDLNYNNILIKDSDLSVIDFGFASGVTKKGLGDIGNLIRMTKDLDPAYNAVLKDEYKVLQARLSAGKAITQADFSAYYKRVDQRTKPARNDDTVSRLDLKCGKGAISEGEKCHKGPSTATKVAAAGLTAGALALGALALTRKSGGTSRLSRATTFTTPTPERPAGPPRLAGFTPRALLAPARVPRSKTVRMRQNTAAAIRNAESRIAQTAREEIRRLGQIGNTMAATGEATGMAVKTTARELRLRTEAARRRFEPGYRKPDQKRLPSGIQAQLPESNLTPERVALPLDPRTGQPSRRRIQGFGRRDAYIQTYAPVQLQPPTRRDGDDKKYTKTVTNPETGRPNKVRYGAKGYRIAPGTPKGDRYCARSFGDMKSEGYDCSGAQRNTPLCLSRAKWKCSGKTSRR